MEKEITKHIPAAVQLRKALIVYGVLSKQHYPIFNHNNNSLHIGLDRVEKNNSNMMLTSTVYIKSVKIMPYKI